MKKTFLFFLFTFLVSWNSLKAQRDYLFVIDDGSTMDDVRWAEMKTTTVNLIQRLLACDLRNRFAVVHYGTGLHNAVNFNYIPRIYIESDFTNDTFVEKFIERRLIGGQAFHESLGMIGDAIDGNPNFGIVSSQTTLAPDPSSELFVVLITDGSRNTGNLAFGSHLVDYNNAIPNTPAAFDNVNQFKTVRNAKFAVMHLSPDAQSSAAGAAIASAGGFYTGSVETNTGDPEFGILPKLYFPRPQFFLYLYGGNTIEEDFERVVNGLCNSSVGKVMFFYEPSGCGMPPEAHIGGSISLPAGATYINSKLVLRSIDTGNDYSISATPVFGAAGSFNYVIYPSNYGLPPGATGKYKFVMSIQYQTANGAVEAMSWNNFPFLDWDIDLGACTKAAASTPPKIENTSLKITPNPTTGLFRVILKEAVKSGKIQVVDVSGTTVYTAIIRNEKEIDIDISSSKEGIYIVNILTDKNEIYSEKLIKK
ncbi:T9SS type A sorting domain-containing protein [Chryseobacterium sp. JUb7]|uniref:T9SS type A sorting domain-containing protein n=1 Tax=Chryseobacterium sp. JUb7 TaxID=2940599 RepID=UPI0021688186|nr:T9SS type A sorting domain-containing protein [Chryseobacterium sp. JUb7]MCS3529435.1 hypothetical protein [Chryseobacterium sp. JUb7]